MPLLAGPLFAYIETDPRIDVTKREIEVAIISTPYTTVTASVGDVIPVLVL
jgi:hypothetical protein